MKEIKVYKKLPDEAFNIRVTVFVDEQGFVDELDELDERAVHFVMLEDGRAIATCRICLLPEGCWLLGRVAVLREYRGRGLGREMLAAAEKYAVESGVCEMIVHSQWQARGFYLSCGFVEYGEQYLEQDCPHINMKKKLVSNK